MDGSHCFFSTFRIYINRILVVCANTFYLIPFLFFLSFQPHLSLFSLLFLILFFVCWIAVTPDITLLLLPPHSQTHLLYISRHVDIKDIELHSKQSSIGTYGSNSPSTKGKKSIAK